MGGNIAAASSTIFPANVYVDIEVVSDKFEDSSCCRFHDVRLLILNS